MNKKFNIKYFYISTFIIYILFSYSVLAEDGNSIRTEDYKNLCSIYEKVDKETTGLTSKEMMLTERVQKQLPELFNNLFIHIIKARSDKRYDLIKSYAQQQSNIVWDCASAHEYYANNF